MQEVIVYIIVLAVVALTVRYTVKKWSGRGRKQQEACTGCPLKDNCGKKLSGKEDSLRNGGEQCVERSKQDIR